MSKESSKQDSIARQFDLPERQSKIATLLKENDVYCICRSSDSTRFMIACDNCEEWYHGDCIKITDAEAKRIKHYFCTFCREHNPALRIEYKKPKAPPTSVPNKVERPTLASANFNVESSPPPSSHNGNTNSKERKPGRPKKNHSEHSSKSTEKPKEKETSRKSNRRCGFCAGCTLEEDCGKCDNCKSNARRRKYDLNAKSSKKCRQKQCLHTAKRPRTYSYDSDDYVPDEVVPPTAAARALKYNSDTDSADEGDVVVPKSRKKEKEKSSKRSSKPPKVSSQSQPTETKTKKVKKLHKIRTGELWEEWSSAGEISEEDPGGQQCIGPECMNETRPNSKYCSDECGLKMASARIYNVLPGRIQEWSLTPCTAEEHNKKTLEENRSKQQDTRKRIKHLEDRRTSLDNHIELISKLKVDPKNGDDEPDDDGSIYCITCGHEIPIKTCLKHMEKCYNKYESQTSFASGYLTRLEGVPIFCDSFNIVAGTYCKRLKVLCPEHTKEPKVRETAVCGCPLVKNMSTTDQFCQIAKKKCNRHFCWEKLRRAEIDIQRVSCWMKLDELLEQERTIRQAMTNRAGVMALMLHSTFDHELRARIHRQMEDEQRQRERRLSREKERSMAQKRTTIRPGPVKPVIEMDMDEIIFKEPLPSKRDKANRRPPVVIKSEAEEYSSQQMTASKLYYKQMTESDS